VTASDRSSIDWSSGDSDNSIEDTSSESPAIEQNTPPPTSNNYFETNFSGGEPIDPPAGGEVAVNTNNSTIESPAITQNTPPPTINIFFEVSFKEIRTLGEGGFGVVILARQKGIDINTYSIKKSFVPKMLEADLVDTIREVRIHTLLDYPNIIRYNTSWLEGKEEGSEARRSLKRHAKRKAHKK